MANYVQRNSSKDCYLLIRNFEGQKRVEQRLKNAKEKNGLPSNHQKYLSRKQNKYILRCNKAKP